MKKCECHHGNLKLGRQGDLHGATRVRVVSPTLSSNLLPPPYPPPLSAGVSYLNYVSLVNQVVMMCSQIYFDACDTQHHKYVAHQLALLYVSAPGGVGVLGAGC